MSTARWPGSRTRSRLGEWPHVAVDTVVHASAALGMGTAANRAAGSGLGLGIAAAVSFALSARAVKTRARSEPAPAVLVRLGNRDGFYALLGSFAALLVLAPAGLPALLLVAALGSHAYWLGHLWHRVEKFIRAVVGEAVAAPADGEASERRMR